MILKLIETNKTPKIGDLLLNETNTSLRICEDELDTASTYFGDKAVLPYGISDEPFKKGDYYVDTAYNKIVKVDKYEERDIRYLNGYNFLWKVNIFPEHFNYQQIVNLNLKDGDELNGYLNITNK
jgi:hypothetical protein